MELMSTCFDKLTRRLEGEGVPEAILGKMSVATVHALDYLKEKHGVIHRGKSVATVHALDYLKEKHGVIHRGKCLCANWSLLPTNRGKDVASYKQAHAPSFACVSVLRRLDFGPG